MKVWQLLKSKLTAGKIGALEDPKLDPLTKIDVSFWKTDDKEWMAQRRAAWLKIEEMVIGVIEYKKHLPRIKSYYMRGTIPDWNKGQANYDPKPHLDIFLFLWLHPSWDEAILGDLRESYINSQIVWHRDVATGYHNFISSQAHDTTLDFANIDGYDVPPDLEGHGELMFRVMFINPKIREQNLNHYRIQNPNGSKGKMLKLAFRIPDQRLEEMVWMSQWLLRESLVSNNEGFLYQYDDVLNYWYQNVKDENYFDLSPRNREGKFSWYKMFYHIYHFDIEKEGDTCRTRFVTKLRDILDEEQFFDEFNQMWGDIKNDRVKVDDPWSP